MQQGLSMSLLALVVTFGGVVGTQLGRDSIAEVRPIFFSDLPDPPAAIEVSTAAPMQFGSANPDYSWGYAGQWNREPVCWGCPGQANPYELGYVDPYADPVDGPIPTSGKAKVRLISDETGIPDEPSASSKTLQPYMAYPITQEESRRMSQIVELQRSRKGSALDDGGEPSQQPVDM